MKYRYSIQHMFRPEFLAWAGVLFATLRVSVAYAVTQTLLRILEHIQEVGELVSTARAPFFDVIDVVIRGAWWHPLLLICGICLALGCATRLTSFILLFWFLSALMLYARVFVLVDFGVWIWTAFFALLFGVSVRWGHVWGIDDIVFRVWTNTRGRRIREILFG